MSISLAGIQAILDSQPLCRRIVLFLLRNEAAMDTARGIATWWLRCDEIAAQDALDRLTRCAVVTGYTLTSGILYGLTHDPEVRAWLRATYGDVLAPKTGDSPPRSSADSDLPVAQTSIVGCP